MLYRLSLDLHSQFAIRRLNVQPHPFLEHLGHDQAKWGLKRLNLCASILSSPVTPTSSQTKVALHHGAPFILPTAMAMVMVGYEWSRQMRATHTNPTEAKEGLRRNRPDTRKHCHAFHFTTLCFRSLRMAEIGVVPWKYNALGNFDWAEYPLRSLVQRRAEPDPSKAQQWALSSIVWNSHMSSLRYLESWFVTVLILPDCQHPCRVCDPFLFCAANTPQPQYV